MAFKSKLNSPDMPAPTTITDGPGVSVDRAPRPSAAIRKITRIAIPSISLSLSHALSISPSLWTYTCELLWKSQVKKRVDVFCGRVKQRFVILLGSSFDLSGGLERDDARSRQIRPKCVKKFFTPNTGLLNEIALRSFTHD